MAQPPNFMQWLLGTKPEAKGLSINLEPGGFVNEIRDYRRLAQPHADTISLQEAQTRNELVYACVQIKATAVQDPRLLVQKSVKKKDDGTGYEEVIGHPLRQLLMRPNPWMTEADFMRAAVVSWDVSNPRRFYCEKEYRNNLLIALWPLNPAYMSPIYSRVDQSTIGYVWSDGAHRREYSLDELLIRSAPAWYNPSPLVAALGSIDSDTAQTDYVRAFFINGGAPSIYLKYNRPVNQPQRDEARARWQSVYANSGGGQHGIGILDSDTDIQRLGSNLDELDSETLRGVAESRICMAFGVPPLIVYSYIGLTRATYSNLKEAWAGFWDATMSPALKEWRNFLTWGLLPEFEDERTIKTEQVRLHYDLSQVAAMQEDVNEIHRRAEASFKAGGSTLNEYRGALGLTPDPAGDYYVRTMAQIAEPLGTVPLVQVEQAPVKSFKAARKPSLEVTQRRMEKALQGYIQGQYELAAQAVG